MEKRFTDYLKLTEGYKILPSIDADRYPEIDGLEGPFSTLSGAVVYYDPKEGKYYDKDKDMYLSYDEFRDLDNDYSNMRDERDEVKEDTGSDNMIYIGHPDDYMDDVWKHEVYIDGKMVTSGEHFELDGKSFDSVDDFIRALSKKFGAPVDSFDLYAFDDNGENPELQKKNFIPRDGIGEGNEFAHELKKARDSGKDDFEVDGKKYPVKENHKDGAVGYVELFFTDQDGGERSQEVEVTMVDGKLEVTMGMPGPEDNMYWDDADIEEQLEDALRRGEVEWMNESADLSRIKQLAGIKVDEGRMKDSVIHDSETMSKKEFAKKHGKELADEYFEAVELSESDESYFSKVANALGGKLLDFEQGRFKRVIEMDIDGEEIQIFHEWDHDGSSTKPVTTIYDDYASTSLGRFAVWDDPLKYADDLKGPINKLINSDREYVYGESNNLADELGVSDADRNPSIVRSKYRSDKSSRKPSQKDYDKWDKEKGLSMDPMDIAKRKKERDWFGESSEIGMFTKEGDDIVRNIIQDILNKIEDGKMKAGEAEDALMRDLEEMSDDEKHSEAMDTEVREKALIYMNKGIARLKARDDGDIDRLRQLAGIRETSDSSKDYDRGGKDAYYGRPRKTGQSDEYNRGYDEQPFGEKDY